MFFGEKEDEVSSILYMDITIETDISSNKLRTLAVLVEIMENGNYTI